MMVVYLPWGISGVLASAEFLGWVASCVQCRGPGRASALTGAVTESWNGLG